MARLSGPVMTLVQLRYFIAAATKRSMTEASIDLHVAQSAVSTAIAQLERSLDVQLFVRQRSKGLVVTEAGEQLLRDARSLLAQVDEITDNVRGRHYDLRGTLRLACYAPLAPFVLPKLISSVQSHHPSLRVEVIEADVDRTVELLLDGSVEGAITYDFGALHNISYEHLYTAPPHIVLPATDDLARRKRLRLSQLADRDFVLLDTEHSRDYFLGILERAGITPQIRFTSRSYETVRSLVARGHGYSILNHIPATDRTYDGGQLAVVPIADDADALNVCFARVTDVRPTTRARVIAELARELFAGARTA
ncbi:LysR substrate-binding domain-containing protein [Agrococcus sp. HG114]|uniref:LysR substrate-binding domain-containing protein n=1 Tax=Agrococcus sp. HG114 TaxID=2969757 RepID=UPI00215B6DAA|nr:LysR substrate-binding domain-containing protein [Agrococcus sp. HG114]MCR8669565.1 LysR substrate-binding domain-containing protein [Agrococcus sp. HG114]